MPAGGLDPPGSSESGPTLNASHTVDHRRAGSDSEQTAAQDQGMSREPDQSRVSPVKFTFFAAVAGCVILWYFLLYFWSVFNALRLTSVPNIGIELGI